MSYLCRCHALAALVFLTTNVPEIVRAQSTAQAAAVPPVSLPALSVRGEDFVDPSGKPVRFWGVNLVALYPEHKQADALAANLAALQINLVRPHHLLRSSKDWNPEMTSGALVEYKENSRDFDPEALDRFDYLNAALRRHGIYLAFSVHFSRHYLPGDVDILKTDDKDRAAWMEATKELNSWNWKKSIDPNKMLPTVDERAALINEEFVKKLMSHVNPYTGLSYANDPQVLTFEILNEASTEYAVICGNKFPDYWQNRLIEKWKTFASAAGIEAGDLYKPADARAKDVRAQFLRKIDEDYFDRMKAVLRATGCKAPVTFSNLWRGENATKMHAEKADHIENHAYINPLLVKSAEDGFYELGKNALVGKPFFIGEFNQAEGAENIKQQSPFRTMLPLGVSAYGSLQNWTGVVWFAWMHGGKLLGDDGWAVAEKRESSLGGMIADGMMIDHFRTTGIIFRKGLVEKSRQPVTLWIEDPVTVGDYNGLMRGKGLYKPGWNEIHEVRKSFGAPPSEQKETPWLTTSVSNPIVSDTQQITKDTARKQLTVSAPGAEGFSGYLDDKTPAGLKRLGLEGSGFATVVVVANDDAALGESQQLIISRTALNAENVEIDGPKIRLTGLKKPADGKQWHFVQTRPRTGTPTDKILTAINGSLELPLETWHECELQLR